MIKISKTQTRNKTLRHTGMNLLLRRLVQSCNKRLTSVAQGLQIAFERLSPRIKIISVIVFSLACMTLFASIIANSIKIRSPVGAKVYLIKLSSSPILRTNISDKGVNVLTVLDQNRIRQFRQYMDSLSQSLSGIKVHDSIIKARPGLMDSLSMVENVTRINK